jgi:cobalt-zinc-cadmium resistance protein CzcA
MTPEEVETRLAVPVEQELLGIPHQRLLRSTSKYACRHHHRFRGRHRHLLGAPAGRRAPGRAMGNLPPAFRRHGADHHAAGRDVHVHHRGRSVAGRKAQPARLGDPPATAHAARRGRRQRAGRRGAHLRGRAQPAKLAAARLGAEGLAAARWKPTTATTAPAAWPMARNRCWCAAEGSDPQTLDDARHRVCRPQRMATSCASAMWPRCASAALTRYGASPGRQGEAVQGLVLGLRGANAQQRGEGVSRRGWPRSRRPCRKGVTIEAFLRPQQSGRARRRHRGERRCSKPSCWWCCCCSPSSATCARRWSVALMLPLSALATFILMRMSACRPT